MLETRLLKKKCLKETLCKRGPVSGVLKLCLTLYLLVFNFFTAKICVIRIFDRFCTRNKKLCS